MRKYILIVAVLSLGFMAFTTPPKQNIENKMTITQDEIVIEGVGVVKTIETTGNETIRIEGTKNKITIVGACNAITIEGVDNVVTVDDVKKVTIDGTGNKVTYKKSSAATGKLKSSVSGVNNKIIKQ